MTVIITGGAGFIGSHLAEALLKTHDVCIIDDLSTGSRATIDALPAERCTFIEGSVTDRALLKKAFAGAEYVFHQAALPSVPRSIENPAASHDANATGTLNVLIAARDAGVKKVICASSSSVYGDTPTLPKQEHMPPTPLSPYAVTKLIGEQYCSVFERVYGLKTVSLRYFNVFGPRQDPTSAYAAVIPKFMARLAEKKPPIIYGDGLQTRDFTYVKDVVRANILAAEHAAAGVYNIAGERQITINELAERLMALFAVKTDSIHKPARAGDVMHSLADIGRARSFGYEPRYTLDEGLNETVAWFRETSS